MKKGYFTTNLSALPLFKGDSEILATGHFGKTLLFRAACASPAALRAAALRAAFARLRREKARYARLGIGAATRREIAATRLFLSPLRGDL